MLVEIKRSSIDNLCERDAISDSRGYRQISKNGRDTSSGDYRNIADAKERQDKAPEHLPKTHHVRMDNVFGQKNNKVKRKLVFEEDVKAPRPDLKGANIARPVRAGVSAALLHARNIAHTEEQENVGVEAVYKAERIAKSSLRYINSRGKHLPHRNASKPERKDVKMNEKAAYRKASADNPKLKSSLLSRMAQKRKIRKQYAKTIRHAQNTAKRTRQAAGAAKVATGILRRHPALAAVTILGALLIILLVSVFSSLGNLASDITGVIGAASYLAPDADIENAELAYTEWETDLQFEIQNAERTHPGFDEYRYEVDDVGHGPHELMAYLTAVHNEFSLEDIYGELRAIFGQQYQLTYKEETEIRTRTEEKTRPIYDSVTGEYLGVEIYVGEDEYEWHILHITLEAQPFADVIAPRMDSEQTDRYDLLIVTKGNRQYVGSPLNFNWLPYVSDSYGWRIHPLRNEKSNHRGVDIAVASGIDIVSAHDGNVTFAGSSGGYGLAVFIEGDEGIETRYAHCSKLLVTRGQPVKEGDVIAKVGSTGDSTGPHLHFEVMKNGSYLNPMYFAITNDTYL